MAKWKLTTDHYLNVIHDNFGEKINYEYSETDSQTNRIRRRQWDVPMFIPKDSLVTNSLDDFNAYTGDSRMAPIVFKGDPTPDMFPVDDEARAISEKFQPQWRRAIEDLPTRIEGDFSASLIAGFEKLISQAAANKESAPNISGKGVDPEAFRKMQEQMQELMEQNAKLMAERSGVEQGDPREASPSPAKAAPAPAARRA